MGLGSLGCFLMLNHTNAYTESLVRRSLTVFEVIFCIYSFLFYTGLWWAIIGSHVPALMAPIRYAILVGSLTLLLLRWKTLVRIVPKGNVLWLFFGLCFVSLTWSIYPALTIKGSIQALLQVSLFGLYFSSRFSPKDQLRMIGCVMGLTVMINLFYVVALPSIGIHVGDKFHGAWKGFYENKNEFSGMMLWSLVVFYLLSFKNSNRLVTVLARAGLIVCPLLVVLSTSKTALVLFIFLYFSLTICNRYRWYGRQTILAFDLAILSSFLVIGSIINNWGKLMSTLGKDPSMSGRTDIWSAAMIEINHRPWFGYGFSAFWTEDNPAALKIGDSLHPGFYTYNAHNGFVDILLNVGWVGMALFMVGFGLTWLLALKYAYRPSAPEDFWPLAVMLLVTSYNITESSFLTDNLNWVLFVAATLSVRIWPRQRLTRSESKPLQNRHLQRPPAMATREKALASPLASTKRTL